MKRVHIIGRKNHGKTTLICELLQEFRLRKLKVGTIKHTHHQHELDIPGKDSHRHRVSGASKVAVLSQSMNALFWSSDSEPEESHQTDRYHSFEMLFSDCDLVLVEGDVQTDAFKIEVWRKELNPTALCEELPNVALLVTDDEIELSTPKLPRTGVEAVASLILDQFNISI